MFGCQVASFKKRMSCAEGSGNTRFEGQEKETIMKPKKAAKTEPKGKKLTASKLPKTALLREPPGPCLPAVQKIRE